MKPENVSRRSFLNRSSVGIVSGAGLPFGASLLRPAAGFAVNGAIHAGEVIERLKKHAGNQMKEGTVDGVKDGGSLDLPVTGITTSFMSTLDVIRKSVQSGRNFIITHEPTFWSNGDAGEGLTDDPVFQYKLDLIRKNQVVVFRFHDLWHGRRPDGIVEGQMKQLGWDTYNVDEAHNIVELPRETRFEALALHLKNRLGSDSIRVMGNPALKVKRVGRGFNKLPGEVQQLAYADAFIVKEADRENDLVEWCRDTLAAGQQKGYIFISHNRGEEYGMKNCAEWVRTFIPEVPVTFIPSGDPFWRTLKP